MKRVIRILGLACMAGLFMFTSCKKEKATTTEISLNMPSMGCADEGERAYINVDWKFRWLSGDEVIVYNLGSPNESGATESVCAHYRTTTILGDGSGAKFAGPTLGKKLDKDYRLFYPVNIIEPTDAAAAVNMAALGNENRQYFYVKPVQQYNYFEGPNHPASRVDVSSMPMSIDLKNLKASATLKQIFGVADVELRAAVGSTIVVNEIRIIDNMYNLWGTCSFKIHTIDVDSLEHLLYDVYFPAAGNNNLEPFYAAFNSYVIGEMGWNSQPGVYPGYTLDPEVDADLQKRTMTMNCIHTDPETGEQVGVTLSTDPAAPSEFCFILRPLALGYGFTIEVDIEGRTEPLVITEWAEHQYGYQVATRAMIPGKYRTFLYPNAIQ